VRAAHATMHPALPLVVCDSASMGMSDAGPGAGADGVEEAQRNSVRRAVKESIALVGWLGGWVVGWVKREVVGEE
jgi:hypothetical protein